MSPTAFVDEILDGADVPRPHAAATWAWLKSLPTGALAEAMREGDRYFRRIGITFQVYGHDEGAERVIPFDPIPRMISVQEWAHLERGLHQRVAALNAFIADVYSEQRILKAGLIPPALILESAQYRPQMRGLRLPHDVWAHIAGIDLVRAGEGEVYVLEDNLRVPSGVSYMIENRRVLMRLFPELFSQQRIAPIEHYPDLLLAQLRSVAPPDVENPRVVLLTPGAYNSAYFEHSSLAQQMGVELVEGSDLVVEDDRVYTRTTRGLRRVDVIYRRVDDDFLDPEVFRPDSMLGVRGLVRAVMAGRVAVCNAMGTGIADDKAVYPYVPDMIRFYLSEEPILANVPTYLCRRPDELSYVLANLPELVVKEAQGSGGYGMLIGPKASKAELEDFRGRILADPERYIAQPTLALSTCPTVVDEGLAPRHVDLRPFVLSGKTMTTVPGGLTRVALKEGSLVVNSSQGGGTKDTWVVDAC